MDDEREPKIDSVEVSSPLSSPLQPSKEKSTKESQEKENPHLPPLPNGSPTKNSTTYNNGKSPVRLTTNSPPRKVIEPLTSEENDMGSDNNDTTHTPLQRAHTTGVEKRSSLNRPWLSGTYDSKSTSILLGSEAVAMLSTKESDSQLTFSSQRRDAEFHELFPHIDKSEFLVEDYSCAWQKEVLVQGRLYLTVKGMHFYAKLLLKWVYQVSIPFENTLSVDKKYDSVSGVFNNSILVTTTGDKYFFASFVNRDDTFALIQRLFENKSAHKTIPMTNLVLKKNSLSVGEIRHNRDEPGKSPSSWSTFPEDSEEFRKDIESLLDSRKKRRSSIRDVEIAVSDKLKSHRRSQSEDIFMDRKDSEISASRRRASLNALSNSQKGIDELPSSSKVTGRPRESSLQRADTLIAKADFISHHSPDLGLIEIARSRERRPSSDGASLHSQPAVASSSSVQQSHIVHQIKHIIRSPSPTGSIETRTILSNESVDQSVVKLEEMVEEFVEEESLEEAIEEEVPIIISPKRSDYPHPVSCTCHKEHSEMKLMLDHTFDTSVEHLWELLFGSKLQETDFGIRFWGTELKYRDIRMTNWKPGSEEVEEPALTHVSRSMPLEEVEIGHHRRLSYIVPSTNTLGPREIKTFVHNQVLFKDKQNHFICIMQATTTPFVPAGDCFDVKIKTCISHQGPNRTQLKVSCRVNFIKSSWIRLAIERAVPDTLREYYGKLHLALKNVIHQEAQRMTSTIVESTVPSLRRKPKMQAKGSTPLDATAESILVLDELPREEIKRKPLHPLEPELLAIKREEEREAFNRAQKQKSRAHGLTGNGMTDSGTVEENGSWYLSNLRRWRQHQPWLLPLLVSLSLILTVVNTILVYVMIRTLTEIQRQRRLLGEEPHQEL